MHDLHPVPDAIGRCRVARAPNFPRGKGRPTARVHAEERAESVAHVGHEEVERIERKQRLHHLGVTYFQLESVAVLEAAASSE